MRGAAAVLLALAVVACPATGAEHPPLQSTRGLLARLRAAGRAEAALETTVEDLLSGRPRTVRGRLALELPHRARLDFPERESLTLREDGGDWLQPGTRQLLRSGPASAEAAMRWTAVLLESGTEDIRERPIGRRGFELSPAGADSAQGERQRVWLGVDGYPSRIEIVDAAGERRTYRLSGWRFVRARGRAAFVLSAPAGFEVVDLP
jgi:hypothetical protein